jgi:hypothetical protein
MLAEGAEAGPSTYSALVFETGENRLLRSSRRRFNGFAKGHVSVSTSWHLRVVSRTRSPAMLNRNTVIILIFSDVGAR